MQPHGLPLRGRAREAPLEHDLIPKKTETARTPTAKRIDPSGLSFGGSGVGSSSK
jgi:hypothetical protein